MKIAWKPALIVSVRTKVPLTIATPITIASEVSSEPELAPEQVLERDADHAGASRSSSFIVCRISAAARCRFGRGRSRRRAR